MSMCFEEMDDTIIEQQERIAELEEQNRQLVEALQNLTSVMYQTPDGGYHLALEDRERLKVARYRLKAAIDAAEGEEQ